MPVQDKDRNVFYRQKHAPGDKTHGLQVITDYQPGTAPPLKIFSAALATSGD